MPGSDKRPAASFAEYSALALLLPVSTFLGYLIGYGLDHLFHTHFLYLVMLIVGSVAGFVQIFRQVLRDTRDE